MSRAVAMPARAIHGVNAGSDVVTQAYGLPGQAIYSVSRSHINCALLDACSENPLIRLEFGSSLHSLSAAGELTVSQGRDGDVTKSRPLLVIGADGAFSAVRAALLRNSRIDFAQKFIRHAYKELSLPCTKNGDYALPSPNALHIWPRGDFMLIALPNSDHSFTCTLFAPWETFDSLDAAVDDHSGIRAFLTTHFPDAAQLIPTPEAQWKENPASALIEIRVSPWASGTSPRVLIIGDAAHATVPFYGQGMNAALEDTLCFGEAIDAANGDITTAAASFAASRGPAGTALCDLSMANYDEMAHKTASFWFRARASLERTLHSIAPKFWIPLYSMVAFSRIPYHDAVRRAKRQDMILDLCLGVTTIGVIGLTAATVWRTYLLRA
jgi:kynurenine 3-monooxygenase